MWAKRVMWDLGVLMSGGSFGADWLEFGQLVQPPPKEKNTFVVNDRALQSIGIHRTP